LFRTRFPDVPNSNNQAAPTNWFDKDELHREQLHQLGIFKACRAGTDSQAVELNRWLTTSSGPDGWFAGL
jgi:hypothetical protein